MKYTVEVEETVKSRTVIDSEEPLSRRRLKKIAEGRRIKGELELVGVCDVDMWCAGASES